jgi:predicted amidohydrolase
LGENNFLNMRREAKMIRAASVQFNHKTGDFAYNLSRIDYFCQQAAKKDVQLIVFPEMCITGYWEIRKLDKPALTELAEFVPEGPSTKNLSKLANKYDIIIGAGLIEKTADDLLYNTYVVCDIDGTIHAHRKIHCFISEHMESGYEYTVFDTSLGHKIGVLTCYDNNIIENARITALMGADILLSPHQTGGVRSKSPHAMGPIDPELWHNRENCPKDIEKEFQGDKGRGWLMRWLPSRAHDNGMFLVFSNGVGLDDDEVRTGNAMIIDCYGRILAETWKAIDDMVIADLDMSLLEGCTGRRWRKGRKPSIYNIITMETGKEVDPREARFAE